MQTFWIFIIGILAENGLRKRCFNWNFCESVQFKLINLVGKIMKKRLFFKGKVQIKLLYSFL